MYYQVLREEVSYFKENKGGQQAMCEIMDKLIKESEEQARLEGKIEGEALGQIKVITNYAHQNDITFLEAMLQLHISKQDQQLIMKYL